MSYTQLSFEDRTALMLESRKADFSPRTFAQQINRHHITIYRELSRNTVNELCQAQIASGQSVGDDVGIES